MKLDLAPLVPLYKGIKTMFSGPIFVRQCPRCEQVFKVDITPSANTFGAKLWTDGKFEEPMHQEQELIGCCPGCGAAFWIRDSKEVAAVGLKVGRLADVYQTSPYIKPAEAKDCLSVLATSRQGRAGEVYLRVILWQIWNNKRRNGYGPAMSQEEKSNLISLMKIVEPKNLNQLILLAEINRELGRFETSERILALAEPVTDEGAMFVRYLASIQECQVREFGEAPQAYAAKILSTVTKLSYN